MAQKPLIAGNWKMNGTLASLAELEAMVEAVETGLADRVRLLVCPPATLLASAVEIANGVVAIGGQDCHTGTNGAHTGDVSASMLKDIGVSHVILGHSERRADHGETDALVREKTEAAWAAGLVAVVCVGETQDQRDGGKTLDVLGEQLAGSLPDGATGETTVIAYEPVWAIGTGLTPTADDVAAVHAFIRGTIVERFGEMQGQGISLLYGGSVKPGNATELLGIADVDGALVGGASLKADDFIAICRAARPS